MKEKKIKIGGIGDVVEVDIICVYKEEVLYMLYG